MALAAPDKICRFRWAYSAECATVTAQNRLIALKEDLAALLRAQGRQAPAAVPQSNLAPLRRGRPIREQPGQTKFKLPE